MPFPLTAGAEPNGKTVVTPVRLYQDWLDRDAEDAFAARSTLSFGIQTLGATVIETSLPGTPTAKYFSWLGQAQYVRRIYEDWEILFRSDLQLANRPLFQMEQIALGGLGSVRGYRTYLRVTDDGFLASGELRVPVGRLRLPYLADSDAAGTVQMRRFTILRGSGTPSGRPCIRSRSREWAPACVGISAPGLPQNLLRQGAAPRPGRYLDRRPRPLFPCNLGLVLARPALPRPAGPGALAVVSGRLDQADLVHQSVQRGAPVEGSHFGSRGDGVVPQPGLRQERGAAVRRCCA